MRDARATLLFCFILKLLLFLYVLVAVASLNFKVPNIANNASLIAEQLNVSEEFTCKRQNHSLEPISLPKNCINRFIQQN